ncbi:MAG: TM2 domain-containing protein, partial [Clostridia bacterium]|nr:TM2 domain-containing protein [Clostridia bacterium]
MDDNQFTPQEPQQAAPQPQTYEQPAYQAPAPQPAPQQTYQQPQQGYQQPAYQQPAYQAQPVAPAADKNKMVAGLLGIFLGSLGIHKF